MAGVDLLSDEGFRCDGRRPHELRRINTRLGVFEQADGSAYLEQGNTKVLAAVYGPHEVSYLEHVVVTGVACRPSLSQSVCRQNSLYHGKRCRCAECLNVQITPDDMVVFQ